MILGVDLGNFAVKTSQMVSFEARCANREGIINSKIINGYSMEEGTFDTEYRKCKKEASAALLIYSILKSTSDHNNRVVVGLPISQYKQDKEEYKEILLTNTKGYTNDIHVFPEGVGAIVGTDFEGIVLDIGGRTIDCCQISGVITKKVDNPQSLAKGTLNLYSDFIKVINSKYILDLDIRDAERILKNGLQIFGEPQNIDFAMEGFKIFVDELINLLTLEYKLNTTKIMLVGGGAQLLYVPLKKRIPNARLIENPYYANAIGFKRVGDQIWR